jgi:hypothetical protein
LVVLVRSLVILAASVFVMSVASADPVQDVTGVPWQFDGGEECDAGDSCDDLGPTQVRGDRNTGLLVAGLDDADFYGILVQAEDVGLPLRLSIETDVFTLRILAFTPECSIEISDLEHSAPPGHGHGNGQGHGKCKGNSHHGHPECWATNVTVGDDFVEFTPGQEGLYVAAVIVFEAEPSGLPGGAAVPVSCHTTCVDAINNVLGYRLNVGPQQPA